MSPRVSAPSPSKTQVNKAGDVLREWWLAGAPNDITPELSEAAVVAWRWRETFQYPLTKVTVGLRQFVHHESASIIVAQRLKRLPQIVNKLVRFPGTNLARMEDIGGCRAILPEGKVAVAGVLRRIRRNWEVIRIRDYVDEPKATGYRGIHVVVQRDERRIEIQLRTAGQHEWAEAVERTAARLRLPLKDAEGPDDLLEYFRLAAQGIAYDEAGIEPPVDFLDTFGSTRQRVNHYFTR